MLDDLFKRQLVIYDGAMGTMLMKFGKKPGERSDIINITAPDVVERIHKMYVDAGSDIICTNTFNSCSMELEGTGHTAHEIITAAVAIAKRAADGQALTALDMGPSGRFLEPVGDMTEEQAYDRFKEQAVIGERAGADIVAIETMTDLAEMKTAIRAVRDNTALPVFATMSFNRDGRTMMGCTVEDFAAAAQELGVSALGMNCSYEPGDMFEAAKRITAVSRVPVIIKLNAGLPNEHGEYSLTPEKYVEQLKQYLTLGIKVLGGCCGTSPEYIRLICREFK